MMLIQNKSTEDVENWSTKFSSEGFETKIKKTNFLAESKERH